MISSRIFPGRVAAVVMLMFVSQFSFGIDDKEPLPRAEGLTSWLGMTISEVHQLLGSPEGLFPYRGRSEDEDNVIFYYPDHFYIFWFQDRVWQVRVDDRWIGSLDGVKMGMSLTEVLALWGKPINDRDPQPTWTLPDRGYPVRIRLYFDELDRLFDLYIYRSDW
jgi:hypothetical protein